MYRGLAPDDPFVYCPGEPVVADACSGTPTSGAPHPESDRGRRPMPRHPLKGDQQTEVARLLRESRGLARANPDWMAIEVGRSLPVRPRGEATDA